MSMYGAAAAKSQKLSAPCSCRSVEMRGGVGEDAGDVGGGRERADLQRPVGVLLQLGAQLVQVHSPVDVLRG